VFDSEAHGGRDSFRHDLRRKLWRGRLRGEIELLRPVATRRHIGSFHTMSLDAPQELLIDGTPFKVGIVAARFNARLTDALLNQVAEALRKAGVKKKNLSILRVPGSNELPIAAQLLAQKRRPDVIVALGVLIRGDTIHYELIADATTQALQRVALDARIPVINGVVVAENLKQAEARCLGKINRGGEFAGSALEMAALKHTFSQ
jgi:6,7-dimethyl-8-ribityllumazine synthase